MPLHFPQLSSTHSPSGFLSYQLALAPLKNFPVCSSHPQLCPPPSRPFKATPSPRMNFSRSFSLPLNGSSQALTKKNPPPPHSL